MKQKTAKRLMRKLDRKRALETLKTSDGKLIKKYTTILLKEKDNG